MKSKFFLIVLFLVICLLSVNGLRNDAASKTSLDDGGEGISPVTMTILAAEEEK